MLKRVVGALAFAALLVACLGVAWICLEAYLDEQIDELYPSRAYAVGRSNGYAQLDKGSVLIGKAAEDKPIFIMGSSELGSNVPQNPRELFPNTEYDGDICYIGHAYVQNCLHALNLGANMDSFEGRNVVIVESLQWYFGSDVERDGFLSNFSELQFYDFMANEAISKESKLYLCQRILEISEYSTYYPQVRLLASMYGMDNPLGVVGQFLLAPYYELSHRFLVLKDKYQAWQFLRSLPEKASVTRDIDWATANREAWEMGESACTNNDLFVYDEYYERYLEGRIEGLRDADADVPLHLSREWDDLAFFAQVCREVGVEPYIVIMSTNGFYYDYIGVSSEKRSELYGRIAAIAADKGFEVLDLGAMEYEPYFYCDVMHLGWRGWLYVAQNILDYFGSHYTTSAA